MSTLVVVNPRLGVNRVVPVSVRCHYENGEANRHQDRADAEQVRYTQGPQQRTKQGTAGDVDQRTGNSEVSHGGVAHCEFLTNGRPCRAENRIRQADTHECGEHQHH